MCVQSAHKNSRASSGQSHRRPCWYAIEVKNQSERNYEERETLQQIWGIICWGKLLKWADWWFLCIHKFRKRRFVHRSWQVFSFTEHFNVTILLGTLKLCLSKDICDTCDICATYTGICRGTRIYFVSKPNLNLCLYTYYFFFFLSFSYLFFNSS